MPKPRRKRGPPGRPDLGRRAAPHPVGCLPAPSGLSTSSRPRDCLTPDKYTRMRARTSPTAHPGDVSGNLGRRRPPPLVPPSPDFSPEPVPTPVTFSPERPRVARERSSWAEPAYLPRGWSCVFLRRSRLLRVRPSSQPIKCPLTHTLTCTQVCYLLTAETFLKRWNKDLPKPALP